MRAFNIKRNDLSRSLKYYLQASSSSSFTGATAVFNMREKGGHTKINRASASIASDAGGDYCQYDWSGTDTDTAGQYEAEFEVTLSSGKPETYPNNTFIRINITEDIA